MKDKTLAGLLGIFLGGFGVHKFYLGQTGWGIAYVLFCWTGIPSLAGFIEGLVYLTTTPERWDAKFNAIEGGEAEAQLDDPFRFAKSQAELLLKFDELHKRGLISDEEFENAKRKALGR